MHMFCYMFVCLFSCSFYQCPLYFVREFITYDRASIIDGRKQTIIVFFFHTFDVACVCVILYQFDSPVLCACMLDNSVLLVSCLSQHLFAFDVAADWYIQ